MNNRTKVHALENKREVIQDKTKDKAFIWTKSADLIIEKVNRGKAILKTLH